MEASGTSGQKASVNGVVNFSVLDGWWAEGYNQENGWTQNIEDLSTVKSYLIVPTDENYEMEQAETLRFTYQYEIPANLEHNADIFGTFLAYYTNHTEIATVKETSTADKVGLTTGEGPQVDISLKSDTNSIKEFEELKFTTTVKNTGKSEANNIVVKMPIPSYTKYVTSNSTKDNTTVNVENNVAIFNVSSLAVNESVDLEIVVQVLDTPEEQTQIKETSSITAVSYTHLTLPTIA